jgi:ubiquinol-cytochrome c reductase cytochrome c1 subunit
MRRLAAASLVLLAASGVGGALAAEEGMPPLPHVKWSFDGPFGTYDRASAQRGFQVYNEVCAACHSMKLMSYRNLAGIDLTPGQIRAIAATKTVPGDLNDQGEPTTRPGLPSDHFASPYPNEKAARAANDGALPPDHSLIVSAREGGADYVHALMLGYVEPPPGVKVPDGLYYNKWFLGHQIHMPAPLSDGSVTYADGTKATLDQEARDVATFLTFASNPHMEERKHLGVRVVGFLALLCGVTYMVKKQVWSDVHKSSEDEVR